MTIGDGIAIASICFSICLYRFIDLKYSKIGRTGGQPESKAPAMPSLPNRE